MGGTMNRWLSQFPTEQFFVGFFENISKQLNKPPYKGFKHRFGLRD
jgi:hypothetical protein